MTLQRIPKYVPPLPDLLASIGNPTAQQLGRALGVSERTVERWRGLGEAPRPAQLAIFWTTPWGWSQVESDAHRIVDLSRGLADALQRENAALRHELSRVVRLADFGASNTPTMLDLPVSARAVLPAARSA